TDSRAGPPRRRPPRTRTTSRARRDRSYPRGCSSSQATAGLPRPDEWPGEGGFVPLDFTAIDFETANSSPASACSVGLVRVRDGVVVAQTGWLIRPPAGHDVFNEWNTKIHGIREHDVIGAATWAQQFDRLCDFAGSDVLVAHNAGFDLNVLRRACEATGI